MGETEWVEAIEFFKGEQCSGPKRIWRCKSTLHAIVESRGEAVHVEGLILIVHWNLILSLGVALALAIVQGRIKEGDTVVILGWTPILVDAHGASQ